MSVQATHQAAKASLNFLSENDDTDNTVLV